MVELSGGQFGETDARDERYFKKSVEVARSFLSVYERASKTMRQAEECKARVVTRLLEEREAWVQVYRNVSDMTVRQLGRKLSGAQQALDRLTASVDASSHVRDSYRWRCACVALFDFDRCRSAPCACCDADPNEKDGSAFVVPHAQVDTCCNVL